MLVGGDGRDKLYGERGNDVLIGGRGRDRLHGGRGEDLLISGYTRHDEDLEALDAIFSEWTSERSYLDRVQTLRSDLLEPDTSLFGDDERDKLRGNSGRDWFFAKLGADRLDQRPMELVEGI